MSNSTKIGGFFGPVLVALGAILPSTVTLADGWELTTVHEEVPGTRYVENGRFAKAIRVSNNLLYRASSRLAPEHQQVAVLTNLCIAHIALYEYEQAEVFCQRAAAEPNNNSVTFNNLGVLFGLRGEHELAAKHFEIAANSECLGKCSQAAGAPESFPRPIARRNLDRAESLGESYMANAGGSAVEEIETVLP